MANRTALSSSSSAEQRDHLFDHGPLKLHQLQLAHSSTILLYAKNDARDKEGHVKELARKLRPEFGRFYLSDSVKGCLKLLKKLNGTGEDGLPLAGGIDLVVIEFDTHSMKLLDIINKRVTSQATSHLPAIATVVILPMEDGSGDYDNASSRRIGTSGGDEFDPKVSIAESGGCNAIVNRVVSSKQMLYTVLDGLHRRKLVELSYKDVKIVKSVSAKYPYFPLFSGKGGDGGGGGGNDDDGSGSDDELAAQRGDGSKANTPSKTAINSNQSVGTADGSTLSLKTMTDWTDSSSMLPAFVKDHRKLMKDRNNVGQTRRKSLEIKERHALDKIIPNGGPALADGHQQADDDEKKDSNSQSDPQNQPLTPRGDDVGTRDDISYVSQGSEKRADNTMTGTNAFASTNYVHLLDPRRRPNWNTVHKKNDRRTIVLTDDFPATASLIEGDDDFVNEENARKFYSRQAPDLQVLHTVGGLDRKYSDAHWKVINASQHADPSRTATKHHKTNINTTSVSAGESLMSQSLSQSHSHSHSHSLAGSGSFLPAAPGASPEPKEHREYPRGPDPKALDHATKMIKRLARDCPPDVQVHNLQEVELTHGKVSVGDRDLLESGMKLEKEGLNDQAIVAYTRAGLHSKSPHLSRIFLGNVHFRLGKFMAALKFFTEALQMLDEYRHTAQYNLDDHFCSALNRGVTNFRVGNDDQGLLDVEKAVSINPDSLVAREILAIAQRRMSMYKATIEAIKRNKSLREEEQNKKAELQWRAMQPKKRTTASIGSGSSKREQSASRTRGSSEALINTNSVSSMGDMSSSTDSHQSLKTIYFPLSESSGYSLKDRKAQAKRLVIEANASGAAPGEALKTFKILNGFPLDLYEGLFVKPSNLQDALAVPPEKRSLADLDTICNTLRLMPFLSAVPDNIINEVARCVEYRTIANKGTLFEQNCPCEGVCFLLRGSMQARLEFSSGLESDSISYSVGDVPVYGAVGYTDLMFRSPNSSLVKRLYKMCKKKTRGEDAAATSTTATATATKEDAAGFTLTAAEKDKEREAALAARSLAIKTGDGIEVDEPLSDEELEESQLPRSLRKGMFTTYTMTSICELLLLQESDFHRLLSKYAHDDFQKRLDIIRACRIFSTWRTEDLIRLARMGRSQRFRSGEVILTQGEKPSFLYLIMKGMCKSYKRPNKTEILDKKLTEAREQAERHDLKYAFQANLRHALSKSTTRVDGIKNLAGNNHLTAAEVDRHMLGLQIAQLEHELARERAIEIRKLEEESSLDEEKESITAKLAEVSTLQWPMLFGESCVQDPDKGFSRGTIIADTTCEIFLIHKIQIQTFRVNNNLLDSVSSHSILYPTDEVLVDRKEKKAQWALEREVIVSSCRKSAVDVDKNLEPFYVR